MFASWVSYFAIMLWIYTVHGQATKPNFLFILADDLGFANVGYHNKDNSEIKTPNIDYLVTNGLELNRHYVHYVCSPTRSSVQSGRLPVHDNLSNAAARGNVYSGVPPNYTCIAERLQNDAGYNTHFVGKWDAGSTVIEQTPYGRGYKTSFGYLNHMNDYWYEGDGLCGSVHIIDLWDTDKPALGQNDTIYEENMFAQHVYDDIDNAAKTPDVPFFIFYAAHIAHSPVQIPKEHLEQFENDENLCKNYNYNGQKYNPVYPGFNTSDSNWHCRSIYQSMVNYLDIIIGNITAKLKQNGQWDNTLIVFSADNGGELNLDETAANNYPLRGGKFVPFEGGIRVNAFVSGGYLPQDRRGKIENGMLHIADWYHTFCSIIGLDPTDQRAAAAGLLPIDSLNMWPLITGMNTTSPRTEIAVDDYTLISGNYKYIEGSPNMAYFQCEKGEMCYASWGSTLCPNSSSPQHQIQSAKLNCSLTNGCLFDIINDPTEHQNIINQNQNIAKNMSQRLNELKKGYYTNNEKGIEKCPKNISMSCQCWAALNIYGGFWGPSETLPNSRMLT